MTKEEYHRLAPTYDHRQAQIDAAIARIPMNINRAGKLYKQKLQDIYGQYV